MYIFNSGQCSEYIIIDTCSNRIKDDEDFQVSHACPKYESPSRDVVFWLRIGIHKRILVLDIYSNHGSVILAWIKHYAYRRDITILIRS